MSQYKFKVGDIVVGNEWSNEEYSYTNKENNFVGKVTKVDETCFEAEILCTTCEYLKCESVIGGLEYDYFDWKDEKKAMDTEEAVVYLFRNREKKLKVLKSPDGTVLEREWFIQVRCKNIEYSNGMEFPMFEENDQREYEVVEDRKLKEMTWGEAYYRFVNDELLDTDIVSCISGKNFGRFAKEIPLEEYMDKWTVKRVYED